MAIHKFQDYLDDYQGIHEPDTIDPTENLYKCSNCKTLQKNMTKECPECGEKARWILIPPRAQKEDDSKKQTTSKADVPREKKNNDVSIANPNIYRGPQ